MAEAASSYILTTSAAVQRVRDQLAFAYTAKPQETTGYIRFIVTEIPQTTTARVLMQVGSNGSSVPRVLVSLISPTLFQGTYQNGVGTVQPTVSHSLVIGDVAEVRWTLTGAGVFQIHHSENGGAETSGTASAALVLPAAWASAHIMVNSAGTGSVNFAAYTHWWVGRGINTLATCRRFAAVL